MQTFLRDADPKQVRDTIAEYLSSHRVSAEPIDEPVPFDWERTIAIEERRDAWAVVEWPSLFSVSAIPITEHLSRALEADTLSGYTSYADLWSYVLVRKGHNADIHVSTPFPFARNATEWMSLTKTRTGSSKHLSDTFGVRESRVLGYLEHPPYYNKWHELLAVLGLGPLAKWKPGKVDSRDAYDLGSDRVYFDFLRALDLPVEEEDKPLDFGLMVPPAFHEKLPLNKGPF